MGIVAYTLKTDSGYAPNPFHGFCTLACCKPEIRRRRLPGDWVLGITPKGFGQRLAYAMRVAEVLTFDQYWKDPRFHAKRPVMASAEPELRCGDNCYEPLGDGTFRQLLCYHSGPDATAAMAKDLRGTFVLVAREFSYFGASAVEIPARLEFMLPGRFFRSNFTAPQEEAILDFVRPLPRGMHGTPRNLLRARPEPLTSAAAPLAAGGTPTPRRRVRGCT